MERFSFFYDELGHFPVGTLSRASTPAYSVIENPLKVTLRLRHKTIPHKKGRCKRSGQSKTIDQEL
jgi:hypothetical protein